MDSKKTSHLKQEIQNIKFSLSSDNKNLDGIVQRLADKVMTYVVKTSLKDHSLHLVYKVQNFVLSLSPDMAPDMLKDMITSPVTDTRTLKELYKGVSIASDKLSNSGKLILEVLDARASSVHNDAETVKKVFEISDNVKLKQPDLSPDVQTVRNKALKSLCMNNPSKGMLFLGEYIQNRYPTSDDLSLIYDGMLAISGSQKTEKKLYAQLVELMKECAKSGYNTGQNLQKFNTLCNDISKKDKTLKTQDLIIPANISADTLER